jgi:hypothetical protein
MVSLLSLALYDTKSSSLDDPATTMAFSLPSVDPMSPENMMRIRYWLGCCATRQSGHENCSDLMPVRTELPTRVVYVGTDDGLDPPRLQSGNGEIAGYVSLSYCWGGSQRHQTERNRIEEYMHALPVERLPKSLQDAIFLTRTLGIQYIWIDSLCIIQDCDEDKDREMTKMANIYKNAIFTISAARAKSCNDGFLGVQERRAELLHDSIKLPMNCLNGAIGSVLLYSYRAQFPRNDTPTDKRAWTYQEQILSRRVVTFFNDAIEWSCTSSQMSDDGLDRIELGATDPALSNLSIPIFGRLGHVGHFSFLCSRPGDTTNLPGWWWRAVYEYTLGSLSDLDDRLPAIGGIASEFRDLTGDVYVAGLWMSHLTQDLQWAVYGQGGKPSDDTGNRDVKYDAPTWTWASVYECRIDSFSKQYNLDSERVEIIDCKVNLVSASAPFGSVNGGELKVRAPLKFLSYRQVEDMLALEDDKICPIGDINLDTRSRRRADEPTTLRGGAAPHIESTGVCCLGLSKHEDLNYESSGLVLAKRADGLFGRIGVFRIYVGDEWSNYGTAERDELRSSWGDDYVVTTITIV